MRLDENIYLKVISMISLIAPGMCEMQAPVVNPGMLTQAATLGECQSCKLFVESFKKGLERTSRGKYEGGDAAWEEENMKKKYRRSEMRLIDIQEGLCKEESKYSSQCHLAANKAEDFIEEWWEQDPDESDDLVTYFCINKLQVCCPIHHYGKDCTPCPGNHDNLCSGNGKCRGDGTRKGNGTCMCDAGYSGINCEQCSDGYYLAYKDNNKMLCRECHVSCTGGCRHGSPKDCVACRPGFTFDTEEGCIDNNECESVKCNKNQFCLNTFGSYMCVNCDKACEGCYEDGPDSCRKCAKGYSKKGQFCVFDREGEDDSTQQLTNTRKEDL